MKYCIEINEEVIVCGKTTTYGLLDESYAKFCSNCSKNKLGKIVNYKHGYCQEIINEDGKLLSEKLCGKNANFNYIDSKLKKGIRCFDHKLEKMLCINGKICIECKEKQASFILPGSPNKSATHCGICIEKLNKDKIDISHKKCKICNINSALFGKDKKEFCGTCVKEKKLDAINLHHKKCIICNIKEAIFNEDQNKPLYCGDCKSENMINIYGLKCEKCEIKTPVFNYPGEIKKRFCKDCSLEGMVNVKDNLCIKCNVKRPSYNYNEENKPIYCNDCKIEGMVNIYYNKCQEIGCNENAWYNYEEEKKEKFCIEHKLDGMINKKIFLCIKDNCIKSASFNYENETKSIYCGEHKLEGMVNNSHKKCLKCNNRAFFNNYGEKSVLFCNIHKEELMININNKYCKIYLCGKRAIDKYDNYCFTCYIHMNPDKPLSRNYKTKESEVVKFVINNFPNFSWVADKRIIDGCSLKRPDLILHLGYQVINIEIDENQHKSYDEICENKRLMLISKDINHINLILIRFNPDGFLDKGVKKESPWKVGKEGLSTLKKTLQKEWNLRLNKLKEIIEYWTSPENKSDKMIHIEHLYFDE